ncbi:histidine kinase [Flavivirga aquimarina]|uniref:Histidine kinase n=1 Tax=Flavivirga aquimarina TaxID=2027862 RepID=A0ABT8WCU6_9FLAO|nr:histidine kinase [Flavivirga aquimarina]MDO5970868.1 histidine kinase [Flavivirga aquimarina]
MSTIKYNEMGLLTKFKEKEPLLHVGFWIIYLLFPFLKSVGKDTPYHFYSELNDLLFAMIVFYVSYLIFFPSKKYIWNVVLLFILFCILGYLNLNVHNWLFSGTHEKSFLSYYAIGYISTYTVLSLFAFVLYSIKESYKKQAELEEANRKKQQAELSGLKSQINPHFLFNTLNTIYSSAIKKENKTAEMILKLSDSFRYVLHEGQNEYVSLKKEITHIKDYISLQEERLSNKLNIEFSTSIDNYEQDISPLLLISFVENAFKYTSLLRGSQHQIKIRITLKDKVFAFLCENPFNRNAEEEIDANWKECGIGIANTKKRLKYLYPNNHQLHIEELNKLFKVTLNIQL